MLDTDYILAITGVIGMAFCCLTTILSVAFPCTGNPRRDCKRNCGDCRRDREKCRNDCCVRERADTEENLVV